MKNFTARLLFSLPLVLGLGLGSMPVFAGNLDKIEQNISDSSITAQVKAKITADKTLNPLDVSVSTHHGAVTLKGKLNSDTEYEQAVSIAQSVDGVKEVNTDDLSVKDSDSPLTDLTITAKINGKLLQDNLFSSKELAYMSFSVETNNQVVYLKGKVKSQAIKDNIEHIAKSIKGVKSVNSSLIISK